MLSLSRVCVVIVIHNRLTELEKCLQRLNQFLTEEETIFLWDNQSRDRDYLATLAARYAKHNWHFSPNNLGFTEGNHQGIKWALEQGHDAVFLLNPDTEINSDTIPELRKASASVGNQWILGPLLIRKGNQAHPRIDSAGLTLDYLFRAKDDRQGQLVADVDFETPITKVNGICGAALWIPLKLFPLRQTSKYALFDDRFFAYFEDAELSLFWRKRGGQFGLVPGSQVLHNRGGKSRLSLITQEMWEGNPKAVRGMILNRYTTFTRYRHHFKSGTKMPILLFYELVRWSYIWWKKPFLRPLVAECFQIIRK